MSSIFHRLDELERVQREILVQLNGTEIPERDENARIATHSHDMRQKVTNNDTLVERVAKVIRCGMWTTDKGWLNNEDLARAAIEEVADAIEEAYHIGYFCNVPKWLRSQVEP